MQERAFRAKMTSVVVNIALIMLLTCLPVNQSSPSLSNGHFISLTLTDGQEKGPISCDEFPDTLRLHLETSDSFSQSLDLYRKDVIDLDPPAYVITTDNDGEIFRTMVHGEERRAMAAYQNADLGAAFVGKCTDQGLTIAGTMHVGGLRYRVIPQSAMDYEFVVINETFHHDHVSGDNLKEQMSDVTGDLHLNLLSRAKRAVKEYYLDVLVVLDYSFYSYWLNRAGGSSAKAIEKAKDYVSYIFNDINSRYGSLSNDKYKLHVVISSFLIAKAPTESAWTEAVKEVTANGITTVSAATVLARLQNYSRDNPNVFPPHDHLMLFTEYDLYSTDDGFRFNNTAGYANIGTMCLTDGSSVSVVEDHGGYQSLTTATHELGHSMGALHDGQENSCTSLERYVMAGGPEPVTAGNARNPWHFSGCSNNYFDSLVQKLINNGYEESCLLKRITPVKVPTVQGYPGQLAGPDEQCRQIYGASSYLCRGTKFGSPADVCLSMYCRNPSLETQCTLQTAATGTCCGNQKWCILGQCLTSPNASCYMSPTCPFGQRQGVVYNNLTCDQMESGNCYNVNFQQVCCEMCTQSMSRVYGCEYGNKVTNCEIKYCGQKLMGSDQLYDVNCCGTCSHALSLTSPPATLAPTPANVIPDIVDICRDTALINGTVPCSVYLNNNSAYCCQSGVQKFCCNTCSTLKNTNDPLCPYGDCAICTVLLSMASTCTESQRKDCCSTCKGLDLKFSSSGPSATSSGSSPPATTTTTTGTTGNPTVKECQEILGVVTCGGVRVDFGLNMLLLLVVMVRLLSLV